MGKAIYLGGELYVMVGDLCSAGSSKAHRTTAHSSAFPNREVNGILMSQTSDSPLPTRSDHRRRKENHLAMNATLRSCPGARVITDLDTSTMTFTHSMRRAPTTRWKYTTQSPTLGDSDRKWRLRHTAFTQCCTTVRQRHQLQRTIGGRGVTLVSL